MTRFLTSAFIAALCSGLLGGLPANAQAQVPSSQAEIALSFAPLVKQASPAVVNIYAKRVTEARSPFEDDPFFGEFFRNFAPSRPRVQNSLGSGVILGADGIVVSNYHVVGMATEINVVLADRREFEAQVLLADRDSDLAILKIEHAEDLPFLEIRNSDEVEVGELVLAIGNPFGVGQTVSSGIVSGLARSGASAGLGRGYFIQTDAPINPGNSGGALIDMAGRLIGINTSIISRSGGSNGIGFAIPANLVSQFVEQARAGGDSFDRPWAGMSGQPVDADLADSLGLSPEGILISDLHAESPFVAAGLRVGDVITGVDGLPVNTPQEMVFRMSVTGIGGHVSVAYARAGEAGTVDVAMITAPNTPSPDPETLDDRTVLPGLSVARANPATIVDYQLPLNTKGTFVTDPGRYGGRVGLRPGDVLVDIDGTEIETPRDVRRALTRPGRSVSMTVSRRGQPVSLRFRP
ncbi:MAG: trypsin-like peptidase domain-containing protein [Marinibacterium sp.]|nr:trypsin-like peptidase domain-containing protein [Marinibacterium sp.]